MEPEKQLSPEELKLVDKIVGQLKSQGIFDQFRKECMADVDTKPAYQNLRQRVDVSVAGFLSKHQWRPDLNKNQLRDNLRKHIQNGGFLDMGVERIVDQVVNPKIYPVFLPMVEQVVYDCLGIERPEKEEVTNRGMASVPKSLGLAAYRSPFFPGMGPPLFSRPPPPPTVVPFPNESQRHSSVSAALDEIPSSSSTASTTTSISLNDIMPKDVEPVSPASDFDKQEDEEEEEEETDDEDEDDEIILPYHYRYTGLAAYRSPFFPGMGPPLFSRPPPVSGADHSEVEGEEEEEEISPPFEPHTEVHNDENSVDSHISGISELASHNSLNLSRVSCDSVDGKASKMKEGETEEESQLKEIHSSVDESSNSSYNEQETLVLHAENLDYSMVEFSSVQEYHKYQMKTVSDITDDDNSDSDHSDKEQETEDRKEWFNSDSKSNANGRILSDSFDDRTEGGEDVADGGETTGYEQNQVVESYDVFTEYDDDVSNSSNLIISASDNDAKSNNFSTTYSEIENESEKSEDESEISEAAKNKLKNSSPELNSGCERHESSHRDNKYEDNNKHSERQHHHRSKDKNKSEKQLERKEKEDRHGKSHIFEEKSMCDKEKRNSSSDKSSEQDEFKDKSHKKRKKGGSSSKERLKDTKTKKTADEDSDCVDAAKHSCGKKHDKHKKIKSKHKRSRDHCKPRSKDKGNRRSADRDSNDEGEGSGSHTTDSGSSNRRQNCPSSSLDKDSYEQSSNSDNVSELCDTVATEIISEDNDRQTDSCITLDYSCATNLKSDCSSEKENYRYPTNINSNNRKRDDDKHLFLKRHLNFISYNSSGQISKFKKPKIAANIYEVRKIMQMRRYFKKLEKQKQLEEFVEHEEIGIKNSFNEEKLYGPNEYSSIELHLKGNCDNDEMVQHEIDSISDVGTTKCGENNNENLYSKSSFDSESESYSHGSHSSNCDSDSSNSCSTSSSDCNEDSDDNDVEYSNDSIHDVDVNCDSNHDFIRTKSVINNNTILKDGKKEQFPTGDDIEISEFKGFHDLDPEILQNRLDLEKLLSKLEDDVKCIEEEAHNVDLITSLLVLNPKFDNILEQELGAKVIRKQLVVLPVFTEEYYDYDKESGYYILKKLYSKNEKLEQKDNSDKSNVANTSNNILPLPKGKQISSTRVKQNDELIMTSVQIKQNNGQYVKHKRRYTDENINSLPKDVPFENCNIKPTPRVNKKRIKPLKISVKTSDEVHGQPIYSLKNNISCNAPSQANNYVMKSDNIMSNTNMVIPNEYTKTNETASLENNSSKHWSDVLDMVVDNNETGVEMLEENNQTVPHLKSVNSEGTKGIDDCIPGMFNKLTNQLIEPALQNLLQESGLVSKVPSQTEQSQKKSKRLSSIERLKLDAQRIMDMQTSSKTLKVIDSDLYKPRHIFGQRSRSRLRGIVNENIDDGETGAITSSSSSSLSSSTVRHDYSNKNIIA